MTFRSKSRRRQWRRWLCAALVAFAVQAVATRLVLGSVSFDLLDPDCYRLALPIVIVFGLLAWETRWDGVVREKKVRGQRSGVRQRNLATCAAAPLVQNESGAKRPVHCPSPPHLSTSPTLPTVESLTGEELFERARSLPHQLIPDFELDGRYLDLLGESAAKGYAPALAKLGEYAMRRAAWVEAYFWMKQAQRNGMYGLLPTLCEIRKNWALDGFPDEAENVNPLFTVEAGSLGRALIHIDSGHEAAKAREFLKTIHPEFVC